MNKPQGFTLIELIAVVVILGFLAATAIPKFMNATDDAKEASIEGVAGGFASAVTLVRSQWELDGRPLTTSIGASTANAATVVLDNTTIWVNAVGYPFSAGSATPSSSSATKLNCELVFNNILRNSPTITSDSTAVTSRYYVSSGTLNGYAACIYHLIKSLDHNSGNIGSPDVNTGQGFYYTPDTSEIMVFGL